MRTRTRITIKRTLRRLTFWAVLPAALLALRLAWGWEAHHRLAGIQAALRAQGFPVTAEDLPDPATIPPDQNAVPAFRRALDGLQFANVADANIVYMAGKMADIDRALFTPQEKTALDRIWQEHQPAIAALDESATRPQCVWPNDLDAYLGTPLPSGSARLMAQFLAQRAILDVENHRSADALRNLRRIMNAARIVQPRPMFSSALAAGAVRRTCLQMIERLDADLDWNDPAVIQQTRLLLADFQAAQALTLYQAYVPEISFWHYWIPSTALSRNWLIAPLLEDEEARSLQRCAVDIPAFHAASFPEFKSRFIAPPAPADSSFMLMLKAYSDNAGYVQRWGQFYFWSADDVSAAILLLAARLYRHDHGNFPRAAADLVPQYLPAVPPDLFDPAGKPLRYRLDPEGPTVWSVGENGTDEGAILAGTADRHGQADIVFGAAWRKFLGTLPVP